MLWLDMGRLDTGRLRLVPLDRLRLRRHLLRRLPRCGVFLRGSDLGARHLLDAHHQRVLQRVDQDVQSLLSALAFCNEIGVVHRDLKPENILLDRSGPQPVLKLIDFGCVCHPALAPPDGDDTRGGAPFAHTRAGASRAGTPRWSTPGNG